MQSSISGSGPENQTTSDRQRLAELEQIIEEGMPTFLRVCDALAEIHSSKLYKLEFSSFAAYCNGKWQISVAEAYRRIAASKAAKSLPPGEIPESMRGLTGRKDKPQPDTNANAIKEYNRIQAAKKSEPTQKPLASGPGWHQLPRSEVVQVDLIPEVEVARVKTLMDKWPDDSSKEVWLSAVKQIFDYCDEICIENDYTQADLIKRAEAIWDAQEAQAEMEVAN